MKYVIFFVFGLLLVAPRAYADCVSDCQASTYCGGSSWECSQLLNTCYRGCNNSGGRARSYPYGAIAYGKESGAWGLSERSTSEKNARRSAMKFCGENGKDCEVVEEFTNTCAAVAVDSTGEVAWVLGDVKKKAGDEAIKKCNKKSDKEDCELSVATCYSE